MDQWTNGPMDQWTNGPMDQWTSGPMDQWTNGPMDQRTNGLMGQWEKISNAPPKKIPGKKTRKVSFSKNLPHDDTL